MATKAETKAANPTVDFPRKITTKLMLRGHASEKKGVGITDEFLTRLMREKEIPLFNIIGIAKAARPKLTEYGESVGFIGQFEATSLIEPGYVARAPKVYLPGFIEEQLFGLMSAGQNNVSFGFTIGIQYDAASGKKYIFTARPLLAPQGGDELDLLREQIAPALPAPKAA